MSLRKEIEKENRIANKITTWSSLFFGILLLLLGLYLTVNIDNLHPFMTQVSSRYSSAIHDVVVTPKSSIMLCFVGSFFSFLIFYGSLKMKNKN